MVSILNYKDNKNFKEYKIMNKLNQFTIKE